MRPSKKTFKALPLGRCQEMAFSFLLQCVRRRQKYIEAEKQMEIRRQEEKTAEKGGEEEMRASIRRTEGGKHCAISVY